MSDLDILSFLYEFYCKNYNALKKEKITCSDIRCKKMLFANLCKCISAIYCKTIVLQTRTKEIFIKELFKLRNLTLIKSWGLLAFRHSYKTTHCSINSKSHKKNGYEQPVVVYIDFKQHRSLSSINLSVY